MVDRAPEPLLAVVVKGGHPPFSKRPGPLVAVLSGVIAPGDEVEVVCRPAVIGARVHSVGHGVATAADEDRIVTLDGPAADDVTVGDVLRRPGEAPPALVLGGPGGASRARLLDAVRWARLGPLGGPDAEVLARLPDEGVVLFVERRLRLALGRHTSPYELCNAFVAAAAALETVDLGADADRLRVTAAAALEGIGVAPSSAVLTDAARLGALTVTDRAEEVAEQGRGIGALLNLDIVEGFASGYQGGCAAVGQQLRLDLMAEGRAVALGWCRKCRTVTRLDPELHCPQHGKKVQDVLLAIPVDLDAAQAWIAARSGVRL